MNATMDKRATWIQDRLRQAFNPSKVVVIDQGWQHIGHAKENAGHFTVIISSPKFDGLSLVDCHRLVYTALGDAVGSTIHALQIEIQAWPLNT